MGYLDELLEEAESVEEIEAWKIVMFICSIAILITVGLYVLYST